MYQNFAENVKNFNKFVRKNLLNKKKVVLEVTEDEGVTKIVTLWDTTGKLEVSRDSIEFRICRIPCERRSYKYEKNPELDFESKKEKGWEIWYLKVRKVKVLEVTDFEGNTEQFDTELEVGC